MNEKLQQLVQKLEEFEFDSRYMWLFDIMIKKKPSFNAMTKFVINLTYYGAPQTYAHKTNCIAYDLYEYNI